MLGIFIDMGEILVGTSGYSYDDWVGPFYPEGAAPVEATTRPVARVGPSE